MKCILDYNSIVGNKSESVMLYIIDTHLHVVHRVTDCHAWILLLRCQSNYRCNLGNHLDDSCL